MQNRRMTLFFTVALLIWTTMNAYVFWRISSIPVHIPAVALIVTGFILWASYVVGRILARKRIAVVAAPLEWIGSYWLGVIFFILICFVAVEIVTGFGYLLPQQAPIFRIYALGIAGVLSVIALVQGFRAARREFLRSRRSPPARRARWNRARGRHRHACWRNRRPALAFAPRRADSGPSP